MFPETCFDGGSETRSLVDLFSFLCFLFFLFREGYKLKGNCTLRRSGVTRDALDAPPCVKKNKKMKKQSEDGRSKIGRRRL